MRNKQEIEIKLNQKQGIEQKGMTLDHDFCYSFSFSSFLYFKEGREKGKRRTKLVVKSNAFLLDRKKGDNKFPYILFQWA